MNRRNLLKVLPLAAMAGTTVKLGETEAQAFEMKPDKKYTFWLQDAQSERVVRQCETLLRERGINATVISGCEGMRIYELE